MKTLTRIIITLTALSLFTAAFAQAQTSQPVTPSPAPSPVSAPPTQTPPALPSYGSVDLAANNMFSSISLGSRSDSAGTVLVIPTEQTTTADLLTINEDMNVMSRIFEKNLEQERVTTVTSNIFLPGRNNAYGMLLGGSRNEIQSMYLQGFGALFLMKVDFPLSPPADVQEEQQEIQKTEEGDPVWEQIRQEMYEPQKVDRRGRTDQQETKYDAEKVENLKTTLIKTLKHAANIRCLKSDESVILTVIGKGDVTGTTIAAAKMLPGENRILIQERTVDGKTINKMVSGNALDNIGLSSPTVLVLRTKKSDIDEFSNGNLDFEKFRQRVQLLTYPLLGQSDGHGSHFNTFTHLRSSGSSNVR